jgi:dTDP-4-amino-4,6-dideoxygalactose transaminase
VKALRRAVPVYPTFAGVAPRGLLGREWRTWFPFNSPRGEWTFSGRVALYHGLPGLKLAPGSTVLVPNYHQGVEIDTLLAAGYRLRYYRIDECLEIDLQDVEQRLDETVSALYLIHYFGFPQPLVRVRELCQAHRLKLIEDCALSLFSRCNGTWLGSDGDLALFSVYKTLPLPHGGFLVTKGEPPATVLRPAPSGATLVQTLDLARQTLQATGWAAVDRWVARASRGLKGLLRWNRNATISSGGASWDPRILAYEASHWVASLMRLMDRERVVERRRVNYARLAAHLRGQVPCPLPDLPDGACPLFFPIMVPDKVRVQRDLARLGIGSVNLWDTSHPTCPADLAAQVSRWRRECLELPIHQELDEATIDRVAQAVLTVVGSGRHPVADARDRAARV